MPFPTSSIMPYFLRIHIILCSGYTIHVGYYRFFHRVSQTPATPGYPRLPQSTGADASAATHRTTGGLSQSIISKSSIEFMFVV